jgi:SAM-dependent methyltransferase
MPIYHSKLFPESALAHQLLDGLVGLEIGGAAHNAFGLDTLNVDRVATDHPDFTPYASEQMRLCGAVMPVDIVAPGDAIPVPGKSYDFVISSHVIEHFYDPISAIREWMRIARKYIFIICPLRDALESDRDKPLTELQEHIERFAKAGPHYLKGVDLLQVHTDEHHSRWEPQGFSNMLMWIYAQEWGEGWETHKIEVPDLKVGNGMAFALKFKEQ